MASDRTGKPDTVGNRAGRKYKDQEGKLCCLQTHCMGDELYCDIFIHVCDILMSPLPS